MIFLFQIIIFQLTKLIESWPEWPGKWLNIFGDTGSWKDSFSKNIRKKIDKVRIIDAMDINDQIIKI